MDTVVSRVLGFGESQPDALALIDGNRRLTYGALCRTVQATAAWLHRAGVRAGDTVALSFDMPFSNSGRSIQIFYALAHLGAVILPLHPDVPLSRRLDLVARFGARWLIPREPGESAARCPLIDPGLFDREAADRGGATVPRGDAPRQPFFFHFSGGTTGVPKVFLHDHAQYLMKSLVSAVEIGSTGTDRLVSSRPWPTIPGLRYLLRTHAIGGAFVDAPFPETRQELERLILEAGATVLVASPWQIRRLLASPPPTGPRGPALNSLYISSGDFSAEEIAATRETITRNVYWGYAGSEAGLMAVLRPDDPIGPTGRVGKLVTGLEGQVTDDDDRPVPPGTIGRLRFRATWLPDRYIGNEAATADRFRGGWFYPGDVGAIDADGWVSYRGRTDDVINFGGVKILPADVEPVIAEHPDVEDVAIVGVPHPMAGTVPVAFVVLRRPVSGEALVAFCRSRLEGSQVPAGFVQVPEIARSADGKVLRNRMIEEHKVVVS